MASIFDGVTLSELAAALLAMLTGTDSAADDDSALALWLARQ